MLSIQELERIIESVHLNYKVIPNPEVTLEANPDDLTKDQIIKLSKSAINRLSIGIQSFFDEDLKSMNRAHNADEALQSLEYASHYFDNITIDLIYGIPNMTLEKWHKNLEIAFSFGVNHISSYALTVEPKTALDAFIKNGNYPPIDENLALQHFNHLVEETKKQGFVHYETSNFGKPDYFSKHNSSYWQGKSYLGIGPSAHSFNKMQRRWNISNNTKYIESIQNRVLPNTVETLSIQNQYNEYVMTRLRTIWGISVYKVEMQFGTAYKSHLINSATKFIDNGLLIIENEVLMTTEKGKFLVDGIASELFMI